MEVWKDVIGYEGIYEVSNLGNVKSLSRIILLRGKYPFQSKEKILKGYINSNGYLMVCLSGNAKDKSIAIHQLVAQAFLNHKICRMELVVNHKNFIRTDNQVVNLEIVTNRENCNQKHRESSSQYTGVCWDKQMKKWRSVIYINKKLRFLGLFDLEIEASNAYQNALKLL